MAVDYPEDPPVTYEDAIGRLLEPWPSDGECRFVVATVDGRIVGNGFLSLADGGYSLSGWIGATPEGLIESYATARQAMQDAPLGTSSVEYTLWSPKQIRDEERALAEQGAEVRVVVATHDASQEIVGATAVYSYAYQPETCYQGDTFVVVSHRGHRLGMAMKAAMVKRLRRERPDIRRIVTSTSAENVHMIAVNDALGYQSTRRLIWVETPTSALVQALSPSNRGQL